MKILHVPFTYHPDPIGGTEVYVAALVRELAALGVSSAVAAPSSSSEQASYVVDGARVHRFPVAEGRSARDVYGTGDPDAAAALGRIAAGEQADVVHFHALTRGASRLAMRAAKATGARVVFTYHTPTVSCARGTLLLRGAETCDGEMIVTRCAECMLLGNGVPAAASVALSRVPPRLAAAVGRAGGRGRAWTALQMPALMALRHSATREAVAEADAVVAVSRWVHDLLVRNGVPGEKLVLSRQGVAAHDVVAHELVPRDTASAGDVVRVAFLGRLHPSKGLAVLLDAMRRVRSDRVSLDVYAVAETGADRELAELHATVAADHRVRVLPPLASSAVVAALANYDLLAVPSQWLETGPLVVLEAFAAGVPVLGSRLGGVAELVSDGVDGMLVPPADAAAWAAALERLVTDREALATLRAGTRPPRTMADVARDMVRVYESVAQARVADARA